ncbi:porin [Aquincola sp. MAHUQ-54]|uniref:Porin n=1 Tax=Aquincola agrisoli TaxID=3119538 RepID=A0AAW9QA72_9BURK
MHRSVPFAAAAVAVVCAGTAPAAHAQGVTVYGILDQSVEYLTNVNAAGDSVKRMPNLTGSVPSRLGFRGVEDLGGGMRAVFGLESGLAPDAGTLNNGGRFFGRFAYVGLAGPWGTLTAGRLANMTFLAHGNETLGGNLYSNASLDPYIPNARSDNAIGYLGNFGAFTVGGTYSLGRDTAAGGGPAATNCAGEGAGGGRACRQWTVLLKYDGASAGAAFSHDVMNGGTGALLGMGDPAFRDRRTVLNGYVRWGGAKIAAGVQRRHRDAAADLKSNLWHLGVSYAVMPAVVVDAQLSRLDVAGSDADATLLAVRGSYAFSKRTTIYAMAGRIRNGEGSAVSLSAGGTVGAGLSQSGVAAGIRHSF